MNRTLILTLLTTGCTNLEVRPLTKLGALTARVDIDVGVPLQPQSADEFQGGSLLLEYSAAGCLTMDDSTRAAIDGRAPDYVELGVYESYEVHGKHEEYCATPAFYWDVLLPAAPVSVISLADDSAKLRMTIDRLLVNPPLEVGGLARGARTTVRVLDDRPIARAQVWWRGAFDDPNRQDWYADATIAPGTIAFTVPVDARGAGTLGISLAIDAHQIDCVGFATCTVTTRGGTSFERTVQ